MAISKYSNTDMYVYYPHFSVYIELNDYIKILDQRFNEKQKKELCGVVSLKARRVGSPSTQPKPSGPSWAISGIQLFKFPGSLLIFLSKYRRPF